MIGNRLGADHGPGKKCCVPSNFGPLGADTLATDVASLSDNDRPIPGLKRIIAFRRVDVVEITVEDRGALEHGPVADFDGQVATEPGRPHDNAIPNDDASVRLVGVYRHEIAAPWIGGKNAVRSDRDLSGTPDGQAACYDRLRAEGDVPEDVLMLHLVPECPESDEKTDHDCLVSPIRLAGLPASTDLAGAG